jgi:metallo-beta-lactamase class B
MRWNIPSTIFFCLFASLIFAQKDPRSFEPWTRPAAPFRVIGNIYYVGGEDLTSYLIVTPKGLILLDGGSAALAPVIKTNIEELGFKVEEIRYLLNSHAHLDHAGGLALLKKLSGAKLVASEGDRPLLERRTQDPQFGERLGFSAVQVDRIIHDGETVELGGVALRAVLTPGHTPGCTTWTMTVSENGKNYDVVFLCSISVPFEYRLVNNKNYPQIVSDYEYSFARLKRLRCDVFLGAHGSFFNLKEKRGRLKAGARPNPFIDANEFRWFVAASEREFQQRLQEQRSGDSHSSMK